MESLLVVRNQKFQLVFYRDTGEFSLTIFSDVLSGELLSIQEGVMNILGVSRKDFCRLKINYLREFDGGDVEDMGTLPLCSSVLE